MADELIAALRETVEATSTMREILEPYDNKYSQAQLDRYINTLVRGLAKVDRTRHAVEGTQVPLGVLDFVDGEETNNPEVFTRDVLQHVVDANDAQLARVASLRCLRAELGQMLDEWAPAS